MMRITFEHEDKWRRAVAVAHPQATVVVTGRRQNRDNLSALVFGNLEVGAFNRDDNDPPGGWIDVAEGVTMGHLGLEEIQIDHYESGSFASGSIAVLVDGRRLVKEPVFSTLYGAYIAQKQHTVAARDASTEVISPCPFCKGEGRVESQPHGALSEEEPHREFEFYVICRSCACQGPWVKSHGGAIRMWNMRTP